MRRSFHLLNAQNSMTASHPIAPTSQPNTAAIRTYPMSAAASSAAAFRSFSRIVSHLSSVGRAEQ